MIETNPQTEVEIIFDEGDFQEYAETENQLETLSYEMMNDIFQQSAFSGLTVAGILMLFALGVSVLVNIFKKA